MKTYENFDILLIPSEGWWERFWFGKFKEKAMVAPFIYPGTMEQGKGVLQLTSRGFVITSEIKEFLNKGKPIRLKLTFNQSPQQTHKEFAQILGNTHFGGHSFTFETAMGKLFGIENYKALTIDDLLKLGGYVVEGSY